MGDKTKVLYTIIIVWEILSPEDNYKVGRAIRNKYIKRQQLTDTAYLVKTTDEYNIVRDYIISNSEVFDTEDKLFVAKITSDAAWKGFGESLHTPLFEFLSTSN